MMVDRDLFNVLLLEDDSDDYRLIERLLKKQKRRFRIVWAESMSEALAKFDREPFDIVVTDLSVPDSFGFETVSTLREHCGEVPIIVMTSLEDETVESRILQAGAQDYLVKGEFRGRDLARAIQHSVQRQSAINEVNELVRKLEDSQSLLQEQALMLRNKNDRLQQLYNTSQEFVDNVSHDLRTPLTVIKDYVTIIREGMVGEINSEQQSLLDKVSVRADDLNHMVDDLLDISKLESGLLGSWRRNVVAQLILDRCESMLQQRAAIKNIELTIESDLADAEVYCDAEQIARVITNLAVNAIKFTGEHGTVRIWGRLDRASSQAVIGVTDNGPGIEPKLLEKIFHRFQQCEDRTQTTIKGFGLGLNIARNLCRINLGNLSVQSEVGTGSVFSFSIPLAEPQEVLSRWLQMHDSDSHCTQVIEFLIDETACCSKVTNEMSNFLNCLLKRDDLLFQVGEGRWLLVVDLPESESEAWFASVEREFERTNRNRPLGPLPDWEAAIRCVKNCNEQPQEFLCEFEHLVGQLPRPTIAPAGTESVPNQQPALENATCQTR